ncbi:MAG: hypothetical protein QXQ81_07570 [Candidatus Thorarchaeota archaeon]
MKITLLVATFFVIAMLPVTVAAQTGGYSPVVLPGALNAPVISWKVLKAPSVPFMLYFSGNGTWIADEGSILTFEILSVGTDVRGRVSLGNRTWVANDTDLALDLVLGVWGAVMWMPGLVVPVGEDAFRVMNTTAYAASNRTYGNYMNGTMSSYVGSVTVAGRTYNCISFNYTQDPIIFGSPQKTVLSYDLSTGILVYSHTEFTFVAEYVLELELTSVDNPRIAVVGVAVAVMLVVLVTTSLVLRKRV